MTRVSGKLVLYLVVSLFADGFASPAGEIDESSESTVVAMMEEIKELKAHVKAPMSESPVLGAHVRRDIGTTDNPIGAESFPSEAEGDRSSQTDYNHNNLQWPCTFAVYPGQCSCPPGEPGPRGPPGPAGLAGRDGRDGRDGLHASPASSGDTDTGENGDAGHSGGQLGDSTQRSISTVKGVVYTRWGRSDCRDGSVLVYAGITAGSHYQSGSGSNYLCLPLEPLYDEYTSSVDQWRGRLYSSEFEEGLPRFSRLHDHTPVCAVCRAPPGRTTKLMVPARYTCPSAEWRLEYRGYLMSSYHDHNRNEYVCFDRRVEASPGSHGNQQGALLYMVEAVCVEGGGLPCGPYVNGRELTCAVCTI